VPAGAFEPATGAALQRVRALCLALPEATERLSHGVPWWFVGNGRGFATFADNLHGDGRLALWCNAPPGAQHALVASAPEQYFVPPYVGGRGWLGVRLDRAVGWDAIAALIDAAHRASAPRRLLARLDAEAGERRGQL
jgi:hypothetical protein